MARPLRLAALSLATTGAFLMLACGTEKPLLTGPDTPPDPGATFTRVQREIFTPTCAIAGPGGCHAGPSPQVNLSLEAGRSYANIVAVPSIQSTHARIAPGLPEESFLIAKIRGDATILGSRMPLGGPFLDAAKTKLIVDWVRRGAPND